MPDHLVVKKGQTPYDAAYAEEKKAHPGKHIRYDLSEAREYNKRMATVAQRRAAERVSEKEEAEYNYAKAQAKRAAEHSAKHK